MGMATRINAEPELRRFIDAHRSEAAAQERLNAISTLAELNAILSELDSELTGAVIPLEQATRPPKVLVDSGHTAAGIPWRLLQCPGGPLVLQMICQHINIALWIQEC